MSVRPAFACVWICMIVHGVPALAAEPATTLQHNPFTRPDLGIVISERAELVTAQAFEPELRATLVAGRESLANIAGELYSLGEEVDGHRLVRVGEGFAVFENEDRQVTAFIHGAEDMQGEEEQ